MKKVATLIAIAAFAAVVGLWFLDPAPRESTPREPAPPPIAPEAPMATPSESAPIASPAAVAHPHPLAASLGTDRVPPEREPEVVLEILKAFKRVNGAYPVAEDNASLVRLVSRDSPGGFQLLPTQHARYNQDGALVDAWGTPYFFHHLSRTAIEIRSAGPDKLLYTPDDLIARDAPPSP